MDAKTRREEIHIRDYDAVIFTVVVILTLFGTFMVFSSSYYTAMTSKKFNYDMLYFFSKQIMWVPIGFGVMVAAAWIDYQKWKWAVPALYVVSCASLLLLPFIGIEVNGAKRWLPLGPLGQFQPAELVKVFTALMLARFLSARRENAAGLRGWCVAAGIVGAPAVMVYLLSNNLSSAIIIFAIGFAMLFVASPYFWRFVAMAGAAGAGLFALLKFGGGFRSERLAVWRDPFIDPLGKGYQVIQSLYAVASGGLFGLGPGMSNQKLIFLSEPYNDFIFAIVCEEFGLFGAFVVLLLFGTLVWRGARVALNARDMYGSLIAAGAVTLIGVQVLINVAVVTNTIPNTGIPMPFISYGGTSLVFVMALMGVLLNVSRYSRKVVYE